MGLSMGRRSTGAWKLSVWVENSLEETISRFGVKALKVNELVWETEKREKRKEGLGENHWKQ